MMRDPYVEPLPVRFVARRVPREHNDVFAVHHIAVVVSDPAKATATGWH